MTRGSEDKAEICRSEGHLEIETTSLGSVDIEWMCNRCGEHGTRPRPVGDYADDSPGCAGVVSVAEAMRPLPNGGAAFPGAAQ